MVKDQDICIECCPVADFVLGFVGDLRCHPVRGMIGQGVKVSLNPSNQGFWNAKGVTMDYVQAYLSWDLDLKDVKQLLLNSLEYANTDDEHREEMKVFFEVKWTRFLQQVRA